ncbi:MAG: release factor glutamine methyltransferase [Candidatus Poriferisodalaceae bacterium]|jgi:release factor glutamine methyltransferase
MTEESTITAAELAREATAQLVAVGIEDAEFSARLLVEDATGQQWDEQSWTRDPLTLRMVSAVDRAIERRAAGEPLQYVLGSWAFRTLEIAVDTRALIPRPETEIVAGFGIAALKQLTARRLLVADLGTGSGAIALSVAVEEPRASVVATDLSAEALELVRSNLAGIGMAGSRVSLKHGSWFAALEDDLRGQLDLVISNPPYVAEDDELDSSVADWEPPGALYASENGLADIAAIIHEAPEWLRPGGTLVLEIGARQGAEVLDLAVRAGYSSPAIEPDLARNDRALVATWVPGLPTRARLDELTHRLHDGEALVVPTDTVAGIVADASNVAAVRAVHDLKRRDYSQALPLFVAHVEQAQQVGRLPAAALGMIKQLWPGPLTIVVERNGGTDPVSGSPTVALRCPDSTVLRALAARVGPLTGTSANLHGEETPDDSAVAGEHLGVDPARVLPGPSGGTTPSTIVRLVESSNGGGQLEALRTGPISVDQVLALLPDDWTLVPE